jgi:hypothetical protein
MTDERTIVDEARTPSGKCLFLKSPYVRLNEAEGAVTLDGDFLVEDLEAIAAFMRARGQPQA